MKNRMMTPEEKFDYTLLYQNSYHYIIWIFFFLVVPTEFFTSLMPTSAMIMVETLFASILMLLVLMPLLFENTDKGVKRRIRLATFFPIDKKHYIKSKIMFAGKYVVICAGLGLMARLLAIPLVGANNLIISQGYFMIWSILFGALLIGVGVMEEK